jgi:NAD(P)-dependent dehydrogenase (short-subunit alcohol dehydrogenase family)
LPLWEIPAKDFDLLIDINIKGVANIIRAFLPSMIEAKSGTIINMSSGWGRIAAANVAPYCASKFAIEGLTQSLALELPQGLAAVSLSPGVVKTQMLENCSPNYFNEAVGASAWAKKAASFLCDLSSKDNGKALTLSL